MNNPLSDFTDEFAEIGKDTAKTFVRDVVKGIPQTAKAQIVGSGAANDQGGQVNEGNKDAKANKVAKKTDPVTGKPVPQKPQLQHLTHAAAQLRLAKLKQVREELEKQKLKISDQKAALSPIEAAKKQGMGPAMPTESAEKAPDNSVANTLKGSQGTGEFKGLVGG